MLVWLESFEDHANFPISMLRFLIQSEIRISYLKIYEKKLNFQTNYHLIRVQEWKVTIKSTFREIVTLFFCTRCKMDY